MQVLIDEFQGDPQKFYDLVQREVEKREIPGLNFARETASREKKGGFLKGTFLGGLIGGTESAPVLIIADKIQQVKVLAYRYGRSFCVSTLSYWNDNGFANQEKEGKLSWLEEVYSGCFTETVNRTVREALELYLQQSQKPVPPTLNPKDIFYSRESRALTGAGV